tara:strand:+ start:79 stop:297 length:219 start_codon:yes stop_codon:yes gene_type:complete
MITLYLVIGCNNQDGGKEYEVYADYTDRSECRDALHEAAEIYDEVGMQSVRFDPLLTFMESKYYGTAWSDHY